ncbi:MAG: cytochrome c [Fimbriimonadaceae bacterium]|nr:cytochrome c [Fimbriimonadaceae bacterium]QYK56415.1 MAG: cytochrome c [Fimbriimonadaceae bacterium]
MKRYLPLTLATLALAVGCHQDMWQQPKNKAQSKSAFFTDSVSSRPPVAGTVAFERPKTDREFYTGYDREGRLVREFPMPVTEELVKRGKERFDIFCRHCHGAIGDGEGMIAKRGFTLARPVGNYHSQRLRNMPVGHFFDVITNGFGTMYPFKERIRPYDRWAIASYIRVLQRSQYAAVASVPAEERNKLMQMPYESSQDAAPEPQVAQPSPLAPRPPVPSGPTPGNVGEGSAVPGGQGSAAPMGGTQ